MAKIDTARTERETAAATEPAAVPDEARTLAPSPPAPAKPAEAKPAPIAPSVPEAKPVPAEEDAATQRGLAQVDRARKKFLDDQNASKAELEVQRAEVARLRAAAEGKVGSIDELKKLGPTDLLDRLDHLTDEDYEALSRAAYARTKVGKADPRAAAAVKDAERSLGGRVVDAKLAAMETKHAAEIAELRGEFTRRDQAAFAGRWVDEAVKAIPADKPTFLSKLHANEPDTARRELLTIGGELEKANDGEPPTQAEVIAEFEKRKRATLKSMGLDADALLTPSPAPAAAKPQPRTLNPANVNITRPGNVPTTRAERSANAQAKLRMRGRQTANEQ